MAASSSFRVDVSTQSVYSLTMATTTARSRPATAAQVARIGEMIVERCPEDVADQWIADITAKIKAGVFTRHDAGAAFRTLRAIPVRKR
jgi:hypothetical protein